MTATGKCACRNSSSGPKPAWHSSPISPARPRAGRSPPPRSNAERQGHAEDLVRPRCTHSRRHGTGRRTHGGSCYACHQITRQEVSFGTIGPSLLEYGKLRKFSEADAKAAYERVYNPHSSFPCSLMPRFGANKVLTIEQIKDAVALL